MIFETIPSTGLAHFSYLIGDEEAGLGAVIDPRRDVEVYLDMARQRQIRIAYVLETHVHADFVSGSLELAGRTGASVCVGKAAEVQFPHSPLQDGDAIDLGSLTLKTIFTPGHTPEHVCFLVSGGTGSQAPWGLFTGDTLFAGEVGRPDLLGEGTEKELARQLYHSLHHKLLGLGDDLIIYPGHGEGSPCGASIGDRPTSTIGYERRNNPLLQVKEPEEFVDRVLAAQSPAPRYYSRMKKINAGGPPPLGSLPYPRPLQADAFRQEMERPGTVVVDGREIEAFGGAHIAGALNIAMRRAFPVWAGRVLDPEARLLLVLPTADSLEEAVRQLAWVGYDHVAGYLARGVRAWLEAGLPFEKLPQMSVQELKERLDRRDSLQVLDVRSDQEWAEGRIPAAQHIFAPDLEQNLHRLDREQPLAVYCGSGYRASIAASQLRRHGFERVYNVPGSIKAWKAAGYPLEE